MIHIPTHYLFMHYIYAHLQVILPTSSVLSISSIYWTIILDYVVFGSPKRTGSQKKCQDVHERFLIWISILRFLPLDAATNYLFLAGSIDICPHMRYLWAFPAHNAPISIHFKIHAIVAYMSSIFPFPFFLVYYTLLLPERSLFFKKINKNSVVQHDICSLLFFCFRKSICTILFYKSST